jgi:hypothetical protein
MIGKLTGIAMEAEAIKFAAAYLDMVKDAPLLRTVLDRLDELPRSVPIHEVIKSEKEWQVAWLRGPGFQAFRKEGFTVSIEELEKLIDQAAFIATLPFDQMEPAAQAFQQKVKTTPGPARFFVRDPAKLCLSEAIAVAEREMFRAAIALTVDGPEQLKRFKDPFGIGPFAYRQLGSGFELQSQLKYGNRRPVVLTVGKPVAEDNPGR